ncbi:MAG: hypothetical protein WC139_03095 [Candidatus Kapaibacterium sp.]
MKREFISRSDKEVINPDYERSAGKTDIIGFHENTQTQEFLQPASTGIPQDDSIINGSEEIKQRILKIQKSPAYNDFNIINPADGIIEALMDTEAVKTDEETAKEKKAGAGQKCFCNDDPETQKKKIRAIEEFYNDANKVKQTEALLGSIFNELFVNIDIDEKPEDEMQNAAEAFLTKRPWDVKKHPDYRKQLLYVIKFNLIPGMLTKYFGRKRKNLSDDELQMRNYKGTGLRDVPVGKNIFRKEKMPEFEINEDGGKVVFETVDIERSLRIERGSYETTKESLEREIKLEAGRERILAAKKAIADSGDYELISLWDIMKNADDYGKINIIAGKKMNRTTEEIKIIKRRMKRCLKKNAITEETIEMKEEYEEKLALTNYRD